MKRPIRTQRREVCFSQSRRRTSATSLPSTNSSGQISGFPELSTPIVFSRDMLHTWFLSSLRIQNPCSNITDYGYQRERGDITTFVYIAKARSYSNPYIRTFTPCQRHVGYEFHYRINLDTNLSPRDRQRVRRLSHGASYSTVQSV